jgi:DNA polymerase III subunit gamma/tau
LERNGHNLQHFARELSRYFRNLLVARIAGADRRLLAASEAQRERMAQIASQFSEEDLTRYLALSLELFSDLQTSLQPRFHLEMGLVRLVHAGRLVSIEEALSGGTPSAPAPRPAAPTPSAAPPPTSTPPPRTGPSPFEMDRAKKAATRPPEPQSSAAPPEPQPMSAGDPRERLHSWLTENGMTHLADAVENATIVISGGDLAVTAPRSYGLYFKDKAFQQAVREVFGRPLNLKMTIGEAAAPPPALATAKAANSEEDEAAERALANPEVQRFREVLGGEVRRVRNLKE